jgi:hypothetical protein
MNTDEIRCLARYFIPKDWKIYLIDRNTNEKQLEVNNYLKLFEIKSIISI